MRLEHIEYIIEAARCNSITKAAQNLFIGQPTLSMAISAVEHELGGEIFYRNNKGIRLTEFGEKIMPELWEILLHSKRIKEMSTCTDSLINQHLHFTSYPAGSFAAIPNVVQKIKMNYPKAGIHIYDVQTENIVKHLVSGGYKVGFGALSSVKYWPLVLEAKNYGFNCKALYDDKMMAYLPHDHPLVEETLTVEKLRSSQVALMHAFTLPNENAFYADFHSFDSVCTFSSYDILKNVMVRQKFLTIAPHLVFYNDPYILNGVLVEKEIEDFNENLTNFIIYPCDERKLSILEETALRNIEEFFAAIDK